MIKEKQKKIILFIILIIIILISFIISNLFFFTSDKKLHIYYNDIDITNEYVDVENLTDDTPTYIEVIKKNNYNKFEIYKTSAKCIDSNCDNKICVNTGRIFSHYDNQMIICAPHNLIISFN